VDSYVQRYRPVSVEVKVSGRGEQFGGGLLLAFADRPQDAPVIHFGGPLILRVSMESGALFVPINYDDKPDPTWYDKHPPQYEEKSLVRGEARHLVAQIGTPGLGRGTFAALSAGVQPAGTPVVPGSGKSSGSALATGDGVATARTTVKSALISRLRLRSRSTATMLPR